MKTELYISTDVEADGPIPGDFSMLSLGSVAFDTNGKELSCFSANLQPLFEAQQHPDTMAWWATQPEAYRAATINAKPPAEVIHHYHSWLTGWAGNGYIPVFMGYPATYDFLFTYWYLMHFVGSSPFGFNGLDLKSYAMALLDTPFKATHKGGFPREWYPATKHTHRAEDDAREQGQMFFKMRETARKREVP
jgi:hypothetical protein